MQPRTSGEPKRWDGPAPDGLILSECGYPARLRMARHEHEPASFSFVLTGGYAESFGRATFDCAPASVVFRPPASSHAVAFAGADVRIFRLDAAPRWLERMRECHALTDAAAHFGGGRAPRLALRLYAEFRHADEFSALAVEGLALELFAEAARSSVRSSARRSSSCPPRWLDRVREMLHENLTDAPKLSELSRIAGVHPVHLAHEFRRHYGASAGEYARRLRIEEARRLVAQTRLPLSAIAARVGFYDQSHFTNAFKRTTGMTPAAYRALFGATESLPN